MIVGVDTKHPIVVYSLKKISTDEIHNKNVISIYWTFYSLVTICLNVWNVGTVNMKEGDLNIDSSKACFLRLVFFFVTNLLSPVSSKLMGIISPFRAHSSSTMRQKSTTAFKVFKKSFPKISFQKNIIFHRIILPRRE